MTQRKRRNIDDRIADLQAKLQALQAEKKAREKEKAALSRDTAGMPELLAQIDAIARQTGYKTSEIIKAAAKLKRTGLKFHEPE